MKFFHGIYVKCMTVGTFLQGICEIYDRGIHVICSEPHR